MVLVLSPRTLGCFEVLPSAVSLGGEARLRGRGLVRALRGLRGVEGQQAVTGIRVVCRLAVLGGWTSLVIQGLPRLGTAWPTSTPWGPSWRTPIHPPADDVWILVCSAVGHDIIGVRSASSPGPG